MPQCFPAVVHWPQPGQPELTETARIPASLPSPACPARAPRAAQARGTAGPGLQDSLGPVGPVQAMALGRSVPCCLSALSLQCCPGHVGSDVLPEPRYGEGPEGGA